MPIFNLADAPTFALHVATGAAEHALGSDLNVTLDWPQADPAVRVRTVQVNIQQDAKQVTWLAPARLFSRSAAPNNLDALANAQGALQFDMVVVQAPTSAVRLSMGCGQGCAGGFDIAPAITKWTPGEKHTVKVPLSCFAQHGADLGGIDVPFSIQADAPFAASFTDIKVMAGVTADADVLECGP